MDGVQIHGHLHRQRLYDAFYRRQNIVFQTVATLATAQMRHENQEAVVKQLRRLGQLLCPEDPEMIREQEEAMEDILRREGAKSYRVRKVKLGERSR